MSCFKPVLSTALLLTLSFAIQAGTKVPGLEAAVDVHRDSNGVPHVVAHNDHDLFYMQGRIHAEDRLRSEP